MRRLGLKLLFGILTALLLIVWHVAAVVVWVGAGLVASARRRPVPPFGIPLAPSDRWFRVTAALTALLIAGAVIATAADAAQGLP